MLPAEPAWWLIALSLAFTAAALLCMRRKGWSAAGLASSAWLLAGLTLGAGYAQHRAEERLAEQLPHQWEGRDIELIGAVTTLPTLTERGTRFQIDVEEILTPQAVVPRNISLTWYVEQGRKGVDPKPPPLIAPGERWQLTVRLRRPHGSANPHGFDFEAWAL